VRARTATGGGEQGWSGLRRILQEKQDAAPYRARTNDTLQRGSTTSRAGRQHVTHDEAGHVQSLVGCRGCQEALFLLVVRNSDPVVTVWFALVAISISTALLSARTPSVQEVC